MLCLGSDRKPFWLNRIQRLFEFCLESQIAPMKSLGHLAHSSVVDDLFDVFYGKCPGRSQMRKKKTGDGGGGGVRAISSAVVHSGQYLSVFRCCTGSSPVHLYYRRL